jgi:signal transduction histidine kinase
MLNIKYLMSLKRYFLNLSLNEKLIGMMLFLSLSIVSILLFLYSRSETELLAEIENQTAELSKAIQVGVEEVTSTGFTDKMRLYNLLQELKSKGVKEISVISNTDEIIASTNPLKVGEPVSPAKKEHIKKAELGETISKEGKVYNVVMPVVAGNELYGYINLQINAEEFSQLLKTNAMKRIGATSLVFGIGILIAILLSWMYTRPIQNVVNAARRVAAGDLTPDLTTDREDEIGDLTKSFNFMVQKLREKRAIEEKLREVEHLSGIALFARGIAHEVRNPLNFLSLSIDHLKEKYMPAEDVRKEKFEVLISSIKQEIERINKLVGSFLEYGRPLKLSFQEVDVNDLIEEVMALVQAKAEKDKVGINRQHELLPRLSLDPELVKTCIFNIILNSFQAMPDGGELTVSTKVSDNRVSIIIEDTGGGVSRENLSKLFDPFFSTKDSGLGLGLTMTKRVVEEHGGKVDFQSIEGKGSIVTISFPVKGKGAA